MRAHVGSYSESGSKAGARGEYGFFPKKKANDKVRVIFENWSTLMLWKSNERMEAINQLCKQFETDILLGAEHQTDFQFVEEEQKIENLLCEGQQSRGRAGYNTPELKWTGGNTGVLPPWLPGRWLDRSSTLVLMKPI